jgi:glycosyltransferase involved in cell wall biosynthesis
MPSRRRAGAEANLHRIASGLSSRYGITTVEIAPRRRLPEPLALLYAIVRALFDRRRRAPDSVVISSLLRSDAYSMVMGRPWLTAYETDWSWHLGHMGRVRAAVYRQLVRTTLRRASIVVLPSAGLQDQVLALGVDPSKLRLIPNAAPDVSMWKPSMEETSVDVVVAGRLVAQKDPLLAVAAIAEARKESPITARFLGDGPMRSEIESEIERLGMGDDISIVGWTDQPLTHIASARLLLSTSETETFGNVIAEALALNVPVVATSTSGARAMAAMCPGAVDVVEARDATLLGRAVIERLQSGTRASFAGVRQMAIDEVARSWTAAIEDARTA